MTQIMDANTSLVGRVSAVRERVGTTPSWIDALRDRGAGAFERLGLPTTRHEEWQLTNVSALGKTDFALPEPGDPGEAAEAIEGFAIPGLEAYELVFVDGRFVPERSRVQGLPRGVTVMSLREAISRSADVVKAHLAEHARPDDEPFIALNTACLEDGAFVHVARGVALDRPILLTFFSGEHETPTMTHPRVLAIIESGASADLIEHHVGVGARMYFANSVTEVVVGDDARASHYFIERDGRAAYNVSTLQVHQGRGSDFASHTALFGGKLVRNNVNPVLAGEHGHSLLNGLYLPDGDRLMDNHMRVHHRRPDCQSRQFYTGVLRDKATGIFIGRIVVDRPAQKTDAVQQSRNLLLSPDAHGHNRPQLEIFADDVKCTHGATIGELDDQAIFYLRSRGVPESIARGLLVYSFANEALERMAVEPVRRELARLLVEHLGLDDSVRHVLE